MLTQLKRVTVFILGSVIFALCNPVFAGNLSLLGSSATSAGCTYIAYTADASGNLTVTCEDSSPGTGSSPGTIQFNPGNVTLTAGQASNFWITRTGGSSGLASATVTMSGDASLFSSLTGAPDTFNWADGSAANQRIDFTTKSNASGPAWGGSKTVTFTLSGITGATAGSPTTGTLTILDDYNDIGNNGNGGGGDPNYVIPENCTIIPITWAPQISVTGPLHRFYRGEALAFRVTMPERNRMVASGTSYSDVDKYMSLSRNPCEFTKALEDVYCGSDSQNYGNGTEVIVGNQTAPNTYNRPLCETTAGEVYYFNIKNSSGLNGPDTCPPNHECVFKLAW